MASLVKLQSSRRALLGGLAASSLAAATRAAAEVGPFVPPPATSAVTTFSVRIPHPQLTDLKRRLSETRWPEREPVSDWSQGAPLDRLRSLMTYWEKEYDWRRAERQLNGFPQFRIKIDGLGIHFIHVRSKHEGALPIILTHGWPGSIFEFFKVIGPLTNPTAYGGKTEDPLPVGVPFLSRLGFFVQPTRKGVERSGSPRGLGDPNGS